MAFQQDNCFSAWFDPLSFHLSSPQRASRLNSNDWDSNHNSNEFYFAEYKNVTNANKIPYYSKSYRFDFLGHTYGTQFLDFIESLVVNSSGRNLIPFFKFETCEGRINLLRKRFPNSLNVFLTRDLHSQVQSCKRLLKGGDISFHKSADTILNTLSPRSRLIPFEIKLTSIRKLDYLFTEYELKRQSFLEHADVHIHCNQEGFFEVVNIKHSSVYESMRLLINKLEELNRINFTSARKVSRYTDGVLDESDIKCMPIFLKMWPKRHLRR